ATIAPSPERSLSTKLVIRWVGRARVASLKTASALILRSVAPLRDASRRMATSFGLASILRDALQSARADCNARQDEGRRKLSYPPANENVLVELRPVLVLANVIRAIG